MEQNMTLFDDDHDDDDTIGVDFAADDVQIYFK
jgi:hypothetical protein